VYHLRAAHHPDYVPALACRSTPERLFWSTHRVGALRRRDARQQSRSFKRAWTRNYHLSTFNYFTSAHVDRRRLNPMINQRSADVAGTAIKAMPTRTETADANG
jgi:hypothetical protein